MENNDILIVIPTYNERENVAALVRQLFQMVPSSDVMLIDDNSPDGTAEYAQQLFGANQSFSVLVRRGSRSFGRSLLDGYRVAVERGYARLVQMDADFSHDPNMVPTLIDASRAADVVIGSRYCRGGRVANWPWHRRLLSRFANYRRHGARQHKWFSLLDAPRVGMSPENRRDIGRLRVSGRDGFPRAARRT